MDISMIVNRYDEPMEDVTTKARCAAVVAPRNLRDGGKLHRQVSNPDVECTSQPSERMLTSDSASARNLRSDTIPTAKPAQRAGLIRGTVYKGRPSREQVLQFLKDREKREPTPEMFIENFPPKTVTPVTWTEYQSQQTPRQRAVAFFTLVMGFNPHDPDKRNVIKTRENNTPLADLVLETIGSAITTNLKGLSKPLKANFETAKNMTARSNSWTLDQLNTMHKVAQLVRLDATAALAHLESGDAGTELVHEGELEAPIMAPQVLEQQITWMSRVLQVAFVVEEMLAESITLRVVLAEAQIKHGLSHHRDGDEFYLVNIIGKYEWVSFDSGQVVPY